MQVRVGVIGKVVVNCQVDPLNVDPSAENVCCNTNALVEVLELLVAFDSRNS